MRNSDALGIRVRNHGFTLLELSIVLFLIGTIIGIGLVTLTAAVQAKQYNATVAKMDVIEKALLNFSTVYNRIPCPGALTLNAGTADYGLEAGADASSSIGVGTGICVGTGMLPQANFSGTSYLTIWGSSSYPAGAGPAEGAVPTRALQLPDDYMYDGWGRRFRYAVDPSATIAGSVPNMAFSCSPIFVMGNGWNNVRSAAAIYALISHGANGHGAYTSSGTTHNAGSTNVTELKNCHCSSTTGADDGSYGAMYFQGVPYVATAGTPTTTFDDIVTYKENWQMQTPNNPVTPTVMYITASGNSLVEAVSAAGANIITRVAGNNYSGYSGDNGPATSARLNWPEFIARDSSGNLYINDQSDNVVRKVTAATGIITTVAGNGTYGYSGDGGPATSAQLFYPEQIAVDGSGNLYIADFINSAIRKVTAATGIITTVVNNNGYGGYGGDGGPAISALLNGTFGVAVDSSGNLYIADESNNRIRKVTNGIITTVAGNGTYGNTGDGGLATSAELDYPRIITVDNAGNLYITTQGSSTVRKVAAATGIITTVAGNGSAGYSGDGGAATSAKLGWGPGGTSVDSFGNLYIADRNNSIIRKVVAANGTICTIAGQPGTNSYYGDVIPASSALFNAPQDVKIFTGR